jgi:hypothetical protein
VPERRRRLAESRLGALTRGEAIAALAAIALLVFTFFDWYDYEQTGNLLSLLSLFGFPANAWQMLDVIPWLLLLAILAALGMVLLRVGGRKWEPPVPPSGAVAVLGGVATLLVGYRIVFPPEPTDISELPIRITVELGAYLALAAAAGIAYGGYRAMGERGTSFARIADSLASGRSRTGPRPAPKKSRRPSPPASQKRSRSSSD